MSSNPLVSVVVIFLNEQRFLQEAIGSVVAQTSPHWELLLVNDGSTDHSLDIARLNAKRDPSRIRYLAHENGMNRGKSVSRNLGLHSARGDYIAFLDGDDVFRPEKIERQTAILSKSPAAMVYGPTLYWNNWPGVAIRPHRDQMGRLGVTPNRLYEPPGLLTMFLRDGGAVHVFVGLPSGDQSLFRSAALTARIKTYAKTRFFSPKICAQFPSISKAAAGTNTASTEFNLSTCNRLGQLSSNASKPSRLAFLRWRSNISATNKFRIRISIELFIMLSGRTKCPRLDRIVCFGQRIVCFGATLQNAQCVDSNHWLPEEVRHTRTIGRCGYSPGTALPAFPARHPTHSSRLPVS